MIKEMQNISFFGEKFYMRFVLSFILLLELTILLAYC